MHAVKQLALIAALTCSGLIFAQDATDPLAAGDTTTTIPEGVVPTPAQTHNPKLLGFGMVIVGLAMGFILFGRKAKTTAPEGETEK